MCSKETTELVEPPGLCDWEGTALRLQPKHLPSTLCCSIVHLEFTFYQGITVLGNL